MKNPKKRLTRTQKILLGKLQRGRRPDNSKLTDHDLNELQKRGLVQLEQGRWAPVEEVEA